jgi:hypothetical protein
VSVLLVCWEGVAGAGDVILRSCLAGGGVPAVGAPLLGDRPTKTACCISMCLFGGWGVDCKGGSRTKYSGSVRYLSA